MTMRLVLEIRLGNDAMQDGRDVIRALRGLIEREVFETDQAGIIRDLNGNSVGAWSYRHPDDSSCAPEVEAFAAFVQRRLEAEVGLEAEPDAHPVTNPILVQALADWPAEAEA